MSYTLQQSLIGTANGCSEHNIIIFNKVKHCISQFQSQIALLDVDLDMTHQKK